MILYGETHTIDAVVPPNTGRRIYEDLGAFLLLTEKTSRAMRRVPDKYGIRTGEYFTDGYIYRFSRAERGKQVRLVFVAMSEAA